MRLAFRWERPRLLWLVCTLLCFAHCSQFFVPRDEYEKQQKKIAAAIHNLDSLLLCDHNVKTLMKHCGAADGTQCESDDMVELGRSMSNPAKYPQLMLRISPSGELSAAQEARVIQFVKATDINDYTKLVILGLSYSVPAPKKGARRMPQIPNVYALLQKVHGALHKPAIGLPKTALGANGSILAPSCNTSSVKLLELFRSLDVHKKMSVGEINTKPYIDVVFFLVNC